MIERVPLVAVLLQAICSRLTVVLTYGSVAIENQCALSNGRCSYNVNLLPGCNDASTGFSERLGLIEHTDRFLEMERTLVILRVEHARRLTDLESQMEKMLSSSGAILDVITKSSGNLEQNSKRRTQVNEETDGSLKETRKSLTFKDEEDRGENLLLEQVHKEFTGLRRELANSRRQIKSLETQLEEVRSKLNRTSVTLIRTTSKLVETEAKLGQALADKDKITTQLSETKKELSGTKARLDDRTKELKNTTSELQKTNKRKDELQADLKKCNTEKDDLRGRLNESAELYNDLNKKHENLTREHKRKEALLTECFRGKTSQFCGFEDPKICGFVQDRMDDDLDWIRWKDRPASGLAGPSFDHTCGNSRGYYMYFDASPPGRGTKARMLSARYYGYGQQCVQFYYYMHGRHIGTLNVYTVVPGNDASPLWRAFGNQGDVWIMARLSIPVAVAALGYQVVFEAISDRGYQGVIAVDDFQVFDGYC